MVEPADGGAVGLQAAGMKPANADGSKANDLPSPIAPVFSSVGVVVRDVGYGDRQSVGAGAVALYPSVVLT